MVNYASKSFSKLLIFSCLCSLIKFYFTISPYFLKVISLQLLVFSKKN